MSNSEQTSLYEAKQYIYTLMCEEQAHGDATRTLEHVFHDPEKKKQCIRALQAIPMHRIGDTETSIAWHHLPTIQCYSIEITHLAIDLDITDGSINDMVIWWDSESAEYEIRYPEVSSVVVLDKIYCLLDDIVTSKDVQHSIHALHEYHRIQNDISSNRFHEPIIGWVMYHVERVCQIHPPLRLLVDNTIGSKTMFTVDDFDACNRLVEQCCTVLNAQKEMNLTYSMDMLQ